MKLIGTLAVLATLTLSSCTLTVPGALLDKVPPSQPASASGPANQSPQTSTTGPSNQNAQSPAAAKIVGALRAVPDTVVISVGNTIKLDASVSYSDGTFDSAATWSSSDDTIVSVNPTTGVASGVKSGIATAVATSTTDPSRKARTTVTVRGADVNAAIATVMPATSTLPIGQTLQLSAKIQMTDGSISSNVVWSSSNQNIALVTGGLVTAVGAGTATIMATAAGDPTKKASATITVTAPSP